MSTKTIHTCDVCGASSESAALTLSVIDQRGARFLAHEHQHACERACYVRLLLKLAGVPGAELANVGKARPWERPDLDKRIAELEAVIARTPPPRTEPPLELRDLESLVRTAVGVALEHVELRRDRDSGVLRASLKRALETWARGAASRGDT
jgi:hypothetical protein